MAILFAWIICPILFGIIFLIITTYFIYKLITSQNVEYSGNKIIRKIYVTPLEVTCCMGLIWNTCLDNRTNRMSLTIFIIWYIVNIFIALVLTVSIFLLFYYRIRVYV
jgi:hypothetical protein